jgi:hypothetical protein
MTVLLCVIGLALAALAFVTSARMTRKTRLVDRLGAAVAGGTGLLVIAVATVLPELLLLAMACTALCAAWFAWAPPVELVRAQTPPPIHRKDARYGSRH